MSNLWPSSRSTLILITATVLAEPAYSFFTSSKTETSESFLQPALDTLSALDDALLFGTGKKLARMVQRNPLETVVVSAAMVGSGVLFKRHLANTANSFTATAAVAARSYPPFQNPILSGALSRAAEHYLKQASETERVGLKEQLKKDFKARGIDCEIHNDRICMLDIDPQVVLSWIVIPEPENLRFWREQLDDIVAYLYDPTQSVLESHIKFIEKLIEGRSFEHSNAFPFRIKGKGFDFYMGINPLMNSFEFPQSTIEILRKFMQEILTQIQSKKPTSSKVSKDFSSKQVESWISQAKTALNMQSRPSNPQAIPDLLPTILEGENNLEKIRALKELYPSVRSSVYNCKAPRAHIRAVEEAMNEVARELGIQYTLGERGFTLINSGRVNLRGVMTALGKKESPDYFETSTRETLSKLQTFITQYNPSSPTVSNEFISFIQEFTHNFDLYHDEPQYRFYGDNQKESHIQFDCLVGLFGYEGENQKRLSQFTKNLFQNIISKRNEQQAPRDTEKGTQSYFFVDLSEGALTQDEIGPLIIQTMTMLTG